MEIWDLYDYDRKKIGKTHIRGVPLPKERYHLVVHVWIQNDHGELLLSKRHPLKHHGGLWECTGGSVLKGEDSLEGALREVAEELGIKLEQSGGKLLNSEVRETHHSDQWLFTSNVKIEELHLQPDEVVDAKWLDRDTYEKMILDGGIVPSLKYFYDLVESINIEEK